MTNVIQQGTVIKLSFSPYNEWHIWIEECFVVTSTFSDFEKVNHIPRYLAFKIYNKSKFLRWQTKNK